MNMEEGFGEIYSGREIGWEEEDYFFIGRVFDREEMEAEEEEGESKMLRRC